jgi:hypothetical protein
MSVTPVYSTLFQCHYDQPDPIGCLGRGAHYSIFRCVERFDVTLQPASPLQIHDFAVIWDEDHDERIIHAVECLYMHDLLAPVQFIGERKGVLTVILAARGWSFMPMQLDEYKRLAQNAINQMPHGDRWPLEIGMFDRSPGNPHQNFFENLIMADDHKVYAYLLTIDTLWGLGTRPWRSGDGRSMVPFPPLPPNVPLPNGQVLP